MFAVNRNLTRILSHAHATRLVQNAFLSTSSQSHLVVNAVGKDRLGIVSEMTKCVTTVGGNVGESHAAKLGSHFSLMMLITIPSDKKEALESNLHLMEGMNTSIFETEEKFAAQQTPKVAYTGYFTLQGADHPGIVHKVTNILAQNGLSVDKMETHDEIAPHGGVTLFKMEGIASATAPLAAGFNQQKIKDELADLGDSLNCDIQIDNMDDMGEAISKMSG